MISFPKLSISCHALPLSDPSWHPLQNSKTLTRMPWKNLRHSCLAKLLCYIHHSHGTCLVVFLFEGNAICRNGGCCWGWCKAASPISWHESSIQYMVSLQGYKSSGDSNKYHLLALMFWRVIHDFTYASMHSNAHIFSYPVQCNLPCPEALNDMQHLIYSQDGAISAFTDPLADLPRLPRLMSATQCSTDEERNSCHINQPSKPVRLVFLLTQSSSLWVRSRSHQAVPKARAWGGLTRCTLTHTHFNLSSNHSTLNCPLKKEIVWKWKRRQLIREELKTLDLILSLTEPSQSQ